MAVAPRPKKNLTNISNDCLPPFVPRPSEKLQFPPFQERFDSSSNRISHHFKTDRFSTTISVTNSSNGHLCSLARKSPPSSPFWVLSNHVIFPRSSRNSSWESQSWRIFQALEIWYSVDLLLLHCIRKIAVPTISRAIPTISRRPTDFLPQFLSHYFKTDGFSTTISVTNSSNGHRCSLARKSPPSSPFWVLSHVIFPRSSRNSSWESQSWRIFQALEIWYSGVYTVIYTVFVFGRCSFFSTTASLHGVLLVLFTPCFTRVI